MILLYRRDLEGLAWGLGFRDLGVSGFRAKGSEFRV